MDGSDKRAEEIEDTGPAARPKVADGLVIDFFGSAGKDQEPAAEAMPSATPPVIAPDPEGETGFEIEFVDDEDEPIELEDVFDEPGGGADDAQPKPSIDISGLLDIDMSGFAGYAAEAEDGAEEVEGGVIEFIDDEDEPIEVQSAADSELPAVIYAEGVTDDRDGEEDTVPDEPVSPDAIALDDRSDAVTGIRPVVKESEATVETETVSALEEPAASDANDGDIVFEDDPAGAEVEITDSSEVDVDEVGSDKEKDASKETRTLPPAANAASEKETPPPKPKAKPRNIPLSRVKKSPPPDPEPPRQPVDANELLRRAVTLHGRGQLDEAATLYRKIIAAQPDMPGPWINLGVLLRRTGHLEPAVACLKRGVALKPDDGPAWSNLGNALRALNRLDMAEEAHRRALECTPSAAQIHYNLALVLRDKGELDEAFEGFNRAELLGYKKAELPWDRGLAHLLAGNFVDGFRDYEARWELPDSLARHPRIPAWKGERLRNRTILVWSEQGMGDTLHFSRYVPALAAHAPRSVTFEVQPPLASLIKASPGFEKITVSPQGAPVSGFNFQVPLLSLPRLLGTTLESIPDKVPYLKPPADRKVPELPGTGLKVGICWAGKPSHKNDRNRSLDLRHFGPLFDLEGATFFSLQKGPKSRDIEALKIDPFLRDLSPKMGDFADTAAILRALDLVITVDTSVAHLAGALARPVWVLLPFAPDWRWMMHRDDSPWYPTMTLFRQTSPGDWREVFARTRQRLLRDIRKRQE